jgi:hypothetical protein
MHIVLLILQAFALHMFLAQTAPCAEEAITQSNREACHPPTPSLNEDGVGATAQISENTCVDVPKNAELKPYSTQGSNAYRVNI